MPNHYKDELATQAASLSVLPLWYPFFARSVYQRHQILESKSPGNLSHSHFFSNPRNYYRGITGNLAMQPLFPYCGWLINTLLKKIEQAKRRPPTLTEKAFSAFFTGSTTVAIANPYLTILIASQKYSLSPSHGLIKILKESGLRGLYCGSIPMALRNGLFMSGLFITSPELKRIIEREINSPLVSITTACSIQALLYTTVAIPLELAAVMRQSDPSRLQYQSATHALKVAYAKHGYLAFKTGAAMRLLANAIELTGFNLAINEYKKVLS